MASTPGWSKLLGLAELAAALISVPGMAAQIPCDIEADPSFVSRWDARSYSIVAHAGGGLIPHSCTRA